MDGFDNIIFAGATATAPATATATAAAQESKYDLNRNTTIASMRLFAPDSNTREETDSRHHSRPCVHSISADSFSRSTVSWQDDFSHPVSKDSFLMANAVFSDPAFVDFSLPEDVTSGVLGSYRLPEDLPSGPFDFGAAVNAGAARAKPMADQTGLKTITAPLRSRAKKRTADQAGLKTMEPPSSLIERRARNRDHARRSRLRKKFLLDSLKEQIERLKGEKEALKSIIKQELPASAARLLQGAGYGLEEWDEGSTTAAGSERIPCSLPMRAVMITDPNLPDNPIVYVSQGFLDLTGYALDQVLGRNCRFLQGPDTDQAAIDVMRRAFKEGTDTSVCLLNYREDGTPFWNQFFVAALKDDEGKVVNYLGVHCKVSKIVVEM